MKRMFAIAMLTLALVLVGTDAFPQSSTTSVQGVVNDPSGGAIAGAKLLLTNTASHVERTSESDAQGQYHFLAIPPGVYKLTVSASGFAIYEQDGLQLLVNTPATVNPQLKVGTSSEKVDVRGEAPVVNSVDASLGNSFGETQVKQIPLEGRNVVDLLSLQPGVAYTGNRPDINRDEDSRNGSVNGARSDQNNVTLDGEDVNDQANGYAFTSVLPVTLDSVQEFRVTTTNYNADQGQGSGAQVSLVTKSGTNNVHGSLYEYNRNTATSANDYLVKSAELRLGQPDKPLKLIRNIFGGSVGGPIQKDRLFGFFNYEGTRSREEQSVVRNIPTPTLCQGTLRYHDMSGNIVSLSPTDLMNLDPLHKGINPAIIDPVGHTGYFDTTFCTGSTPANDPSVGDGLNYEGFRWRAPVSLDNNAMVARVDYNLTARGTQTLFWRGAMQNLRNPQAPFLPGSPAQQTLSDHSKGFAVGYTAVISNTMVNTFHWGFTRQSSGIVGDTNQPWNQFFSLDQGISYSHNLQMPVHSFVDDFSWTKGSHTIQLGTNIGIARNPRTSYLHSFSVGKGATNWMSPTGFAQTAGGDCSGGSPLDPCYGGFPEAASATEYDYPMLALLGMVSNVVANYNYDRKGNLLGVGEPVKRRYGMNWYEFYAQDSWRVRPNLTVTYGLRYSLFPPPWEVNGYQASPTFSLGDQYAQATANMLKGVGWSSAQLVSYQLGGPANGGPGFYQTEKHDFAPRVAFAYTPRFDAPWLKKLTGENQTVFRGGVGMVYDRAGMELISTFDANAPAGLSATVQNPCCIPGVDDAADVPRITSINTIPPDPAFFTPAPAGQFPQTPPNGGQAITYGVDDRIKTPYAYTVDFSIQRELPKGFAVELAYVGRFGRHLLTQRDLRQPLDLFDPKTGMDYFAAITALSQIARANAPAIASGAKSYQQTLSAVNDSVVGSNVAQYWHDMLPALSGGASSYQTYCGGIIQPGSAGLIQAVYDLYFNPACTYVGNEVVGLGNIDIYGGLTDNLGDPINFGGAPGQMLNNQLTSMYAWSSIGNSSYNALQASVRKRLGGGLQFDFNYAYSKSLDITSSATRLPYSASFNTGVPGVRLVNAFSPKSRYAPSDFDTRHQVNANWIFDVPYGKGLRYGSDSGAAMNAIFGGWELTGTTRWTSGFPFTVDNGNYWPTDWDQNGIALMVSRPKTGAYRQPDGTVSVFANPAQAINDFVHPYPGQAGSRNVLRGDGYAGLDMGLSKRWKLPWETQSLQFRWEVFNVPNFVRFNVAGGLGVNAPSLQQVDTKFGDYTGLLTQPRVMQFALRYEF